MANEIRVRSNFQAGTITDNPLTNVATTVNSAAFAGLPAIGATQHLPIVLDPLASAGAPEIVYVTAHTASATSATVVRAQEGTAARQHASGTVWRHAPTIFDYDYIATSGTRPSTPYYGQTVFETDTNTITARDTAGAWQTAVRLGAWLAYTPTWTGSVGNGTLSGKYNRVGRHIWFDIRLRWGSTTTHPASTQTFGLPVASVTPFAFQAVGTATLEDTGTSLYTRFAHATTTTTFFLGIDNTAVTNTVPMTWTTGDGVSIIGMYEAAS